MILCVCPSPAIDLTYAAGAVRVGATNRVERTGRRAGGKAVNVARVLHALGEPVRLLAAVGGADAAPFARDLDAAGIDTALVADSEPLRRTAAVVTQEHTTLFCEPARTSVWSDVVAAARDAARDADVVVVSGSVPLGAPDDALAELVEAVGGPPVVLDSAGPQLRDAAHRRLTLIKPNAQELQEIFGCDRHGIGDLAERLGVGVVASFGPDGVHAAVDGTRFAVRPARPVLGNPTGAGDALVAGLARGLRSGAPTASVLRDAVALSAAESVI